MDKLPKCGANYVALTPLTFLKRAAKVYSDRKSIIYGPLSFTWLDTYERCCRLASALKSLNIAKNAVVSVLAPNIPALYEMHFAVPMAAAVLNAINTRLDARNIAAILSHSEAKVFFIDHQFITVARDALRLLAAGTTAMPLVAVIDDLVTPTGARLGALEYEDLLRRGDPSYTPEEVADEWDPITLNYTSGTTSEPKGVVYSHRGAYLSTLSLILGWGMGTEPVYLWTLPMFHCNGWTFTWGVAARGGTNVCIRHVIATDIYDSISLHKVTHMCCAPVVFTILLEASTATTTATAAVEILTGGAPPPAAVLEKIENLGFRVTHAYGLTEATGPALVCEWQARWDRLDRGDRARLKARQGISVLTLADVDVRDGETDGSVARDGRTMGEIVLRGNGVMKGYLKDEVATRAAFRCGGGGWFHTGDVAVVHPNGYVEIKDRCKDVIISGGENISSIEVEAALYGHPAVREAAVVAMPHEKWGESPFAVVVLRKGGPGADEAEIVRHCRERLPGFMVPRKVVFVEELPKTATGKVQKFQLREMARSFAEGSPAASDSGKNEISGPSADSSREVPARDHYRPCHDEQIFAMSRL